MITELIVASNINRSILFTLIATVPISSWFTSQSNTIKMKPFPFT